MRSLTADVRRPVVNLREGPAHWRGTLCIRELVRDTESLDALLVVNSLTARVQSVPHKHRSKPKASNTLPRDSQMSGYGNGSWDRVQAPEFLMATLSNSARETTLAKSAKGSGGAGGTKGWDRPT